jgi:hypothetical protein
MSYFRRRQNDDRLAKHVDMDNGPIFFAPFTMGPPAVRLRGLMDIANYRQWLGPGWEGQR